MRSLPDIKKRNEESVEKTITDLRAEVALLKKHDTRADLIFGFAGWLTCREEVLHVGSSCECSPLAELIAEFCKVNNLEVSDQYPDTFKVPEEGI